MPKKESLESIWAVILPYPIGTKVRYVKAECSCDNCPIRVLLGLEGIIIRYLTNQERTRLKADTYKHLLKKEVIYLVRFRSIHYNREVPLRHSELKAV